MQRPNRIGDILVENGSISPVLLKKALERQKKSKQHTRLGVIFLDKNAITEEQLQSALSARLDIQQVDLDSYAVDVDAVGLIPKLLCQRYGIVAISKSEGRVDLAVHDPMDYYAIEDVKSLLPAHAHLLLASRRQIDAVISKYYAEIETKRTIDVDKIVQRAAPVFFLQEEEDESAPIISLVNSVLIKAYSDGASDVHYEPFEEEVIVRQRLDGQLLPLMTVDARFASHLVTRIKLLASLNIAEHHTPTDWPLKFPAG